MTSSDLSGHDVKSDHLPLRSLGTLKALRVAYPV
jgi:hypothetical protein